MIYLSSMFSDAENGFLNLEFDSFYVPAKDKRQNIFVYHRKEFKAITVCTRKHIKDDPESL